MSLRIDKELAMSALLMAVWRRKPTAEVLVHSDQGSQFSSYDWRDFLESHNLVQSMSMSRRGNCHDNAVAESFFQLLKRERVRRKVYAMRDEARQDVFDYIEMFYNPKRRHTFNERLSPVEFEKAAFLTAAEYLGKWWRFTISKLLCDRKRRQSGHIDAEGTSAVTGIKRLVSSPQA